MVILPRAKEKTLVEMTEVIRDEIDTADGGDHEPRKNEYSNRPFNWREIASTHNRFGNYILKNINNCNNFISLF